MKAPTKLERIFANHISGMGLIFIIHKELIVQQWKSRWIDISSKMIYKWRTSILKDFQHHQSPENVGENHNRYHFTSISMTIIKKTKNNMLVGI